LYDKSCKRCGRNDILFKNELNLTKEIVIIRLTIFALQNNKLIKIPQKFNLSTKWWMLYFIIAQILSKVIIQECIEKTDLGLKLRKQIKKKQWSRGPKDIYILFLQKSFNKNIY